jgi:alginate O-acetyltransferase complex protein AlgI
MQLLSFDYLGIFLTATALIYGVMPKKFKWAVLLAASYVFYYINSRYLIVCILATTVTVYAAGIFINRISDLQKAAMKSAADPEEKKAVRANAKWQKKFVMLVCVLLNIGLLVFMKYRFFVGGTLDRIGDLFGLAPLFPSAGKVILPLGISFYTLQAVSYVIDVYRGKYRASESFGKVALFVAFFPQIFEGPIGRFDLLADQLYEGHEMKYDRIVSAMTLIGWGMVKKFVVADRLNPLINSVFSDYYNYSGLVIAGAAVGYTIQLYCDFSGAIDIARGSAEYFGVYMSPNFARPYFSKSVNEFWRRWHISLGTWIKDYVFYPLSLSKRFAKRGKFCSEHFGHFMGTFIPMTCALFWVWMVNGVWHGASWKYVCYGMYYFLITVLGMLFEPLFKKFFAVTHIDRQKMPWKIFQMIRTFILVCIGMMLFKADTLTVFFHMFTSMFSGSGLAPVISGELFTHGADRHDVMLAAVFSLLILLAGAYQEKGHCIRKEIQNSRLPLRWTVYLSMIFILVIFGTYGAGYLPADPIYAGF